MTRIWGKHMKKDLEPRVLTNGGELYFCFVHSKSKKPKYYYDLIWCPENQNTEIEEESIDLYMNGDSLSKLTLSSYFAINNSLMLHNFKYNLNKTRHEFNRNY